MTPTLRIDSAREVLRIHENVTLRFPQEPARLEFTLPQLDEGRNRELSDRLNPLYNACGCKPGAAAGLAGLAGVVLWVFLRVSPLEWIDLGWGLLALSAGVVTGKLVGLAVARRMLLKGIQALLLQLMISRLPIPNLQTFEKDVGRIPPW